MVKYYLQKWVLVTRKFAAFDYFYRGLYRILTRAVIAAISRFSAIKTVRVIRSARERNFATGLSDIDLIAVLKTENESAYLRAVRFLGAVNLVLPKMAPLYQFCFSLEEEELQLPGVAHWIGVHDRALLSEIGASSPKEFEGAGRVVAMRNALRWFFTYYQPNAIISPARRQPLRNERRRYYRILRDLYYGAGLCEYDVYSSEATFLEAQFTWNEQLGIREEKGLSIFEVQSFYLAKDCFKKLWLEFDRITKDIVKVDIARPYPESKVKARLSFLEPLENSIWIERDFRIPARAPLTLVASWEMLALYRFLFPTCTLGKVFAWSPTDPAIKKWVHAYDALQVGRDYRESLVDSPEHLTRIARFYSGKSGVKESTCRSRNRWRTYRAHRPSVSENHDKLIRYTRSKDQVWRKLPEAPFRGRESGPNQIPNRQKFL